MDHKEKTDYIHGDLNNTGKREPITLKPKNTLLFIGDSITDVGRNREDEMDLGKGYALLLGSYLMNKYPSYDLTIYNRGIGGDKVVDLKNRWEKDCLNLTPDIVTILVGINDVWWHIDDEEEKLNDAALGKFEEDYRWLLKTLAHRTDARVILMEPFVLPHPKDRMSWRKHVDPRIQIVRRLANEYHAVLVPLDGILNSLGIQNRFQMYTGDDGVHPTFAGHAAIAEAWKQYVGL